MVLSCPPDRWRNISSLSLILFLTAITFLPSLKNGFTNWDDPAYLLENDLIQHLSWPTVKILFSRFMATQYNPLVFLSFAWEHHFFGLNPFVYHLTNLVLHLLNTALVFWMVFLLTYKSIPASVTALLFGIHPLHVESVAWVAMRKDVLYTFFFLGALISYVFYLQSQRLERKFWYLAFGLFILSLLSKPMAVTLPAVLILLNVYGSTRYARSPLEVSNPFDSAQDSTLSKVEGANHPERVEGLPQNRKTEPHGLQSMDEWVVPLTEGRNNKTDKGPRTSRRISSYGTSVMAKARGTVLSPTNSVSWFPFLRDTIPFFLLSMLFAVISLRAAVPVPPELDEEVLHWQDRLIFVGYHMGMYLMKIFFPLRLSCRYPYVLDYFGGVLGLLLLSVFIFICVSLRQKAWTREVTFGSLFFLITMILVLPFWPMYQIVLADRYVYLASIGLFFLLGQGMDGLLKRSDLLPKFKRLFLLLGIGYVGALSYLSFERCHIWHDSEILWTDAIQKFPRLEVGYLNRGEFYLKQQDWDKARRDFEMALKVRPRYSRAYSMLGVLSQELGKHDEAIDYFNQALALDPDLIEGYNNRGNVYHMKGQLTDALAEFNRVLAIEDTYLPAYINRGEVYRKMGQYAEAFQDFQKALELNPVSAVVYNNRGNVYRQMGDLQKAITDYTQAIQLVTNFLPAYYNRAISYAMSEEEDRAWQDFERVQSLGLNGVALQRLQEILISELGVDGKVHWNGP